MREPDRDITRLEHILNAINCVEEYTNGITETQLKSQIESYIVDIHRK